jgi:hypothetical protein
MNTTVPTGTIMKNTILCANCQVCGTKLPNPVLDLGMQPMCDDLIDIGSNRRSAKYPIQISLCPKCITAHQVYNIEKEVLFPAEYHYRPRFTQDVLDGMQELVIQCQEKLGSLEDKLACDVGCNDGSLLNFFSEKGARTCGIEPTDAALDAKERDHYVENSYFDCKAARKIVSKVGNPDIVTFTNVFAHIQDLDEAIAALKILIKPTTVVIIENHYLGTILKTNQFDTFYHEHPRTYSCKSFELIAQKLGGKLLSIDFPKRYGGNIRVSIGNFGNDSGSGRASLETFDLPDESDFLQQFNQMQEFVDTWKDKTTEAIATLRKDGITLCGKSFPGRAAILITLLQLDSSIMPCVYEKPGSLKIGKYLPGTDIEIHSDERWVNGQDNPETMVIWGWHIAAEIAEYIRDNGYNGRIFSPLPEFKEII